MNKLITLESKVLEIIQELNNKGHLSLIVGGAVRDAILGIEPKDIDIEVYGINYNDLMKFLSKHGRVDLVGKKFGVIVFNPKGCEMKYDFSVPRKENKVGTTHKDYEIVFDINMTIEVASQRRDFTMNSISYDPIGNITYDYYGGINDIKNKIIRHTSDKFSEDYLRILRCMGFQARFGFEIHPDTIELMKKMLLTSNEYNELSVERVYEEFCKWTEKGIRHDLIFKFMRDTGLIEYYPVLKALKETPQDKIWHGEGDVEIHTEMCLREIDRIILENNITGIEKSILVISTLTHDIGKKDTTVHEVKNGRMAITSNGHEALGGKMVIELLSLLGFNESIITPISNLVSNHLSGVSISLIPTHSGKIKAVKKLSRRLFPATIQQLLFLMEADSYGRFPKRESTGANEIALIAKDLDVTIKQYQYILMGRHLIQKGLRPSEKFGIILKHSHEAQENGIFNDEDGANIWLNEYLKSEHYFKLI